MPFDRLFIRAGGQAYGPFTIEQIGRAVSERRLTPSHEISPDGEVWFAAGTVWDELQPPPSKSSAADLSGGRNETRRRSSGESPRRRRRSSSDRSPPRPASAAVSEPRLTGRRSRSDERLLSSPFSGDGARLNSAAHDDYVRDVGLPIVSGRAVRIAIVCYGLTAITAALPTIFALHAVERWRQAVIQLNLTRVKSDVPQRQDQVTAAEEELESVGRTAARLRLSQSGCWLLVAVLFLIWKYGVSMALRRMGVSGMEFSPAACVYWYFVPIAQLFKPYQAMKELWTAADSRSFDYWREGTYGWVTAWWATFLGGNIVAFMVRFGIALLLYHDRPADRLSTSLLWEPFFVALHLGQTVVFFLLITKLCGRLRRKVDVECEEAAADYVPADEQA